MALVAIGVAGGAWWMTRGGTSAPGTTLPVPPAEAPWGPAALAMGPVEAFATGAALADSGLAFQSLPYLHRSVAAPGAPWQAWRAYAGALYNASMSPAPDPLSAPDPGPRSSFERTGLMRQALARIDRAAALAGTPGDRALVQLMRAQFLRTWGFPWDALQDFHAAGELAPEWTSQGVIYASRMRDPLSPDPR